MEFYSWENKPGKGACSLTNLKNVDDVVDIKRGRPRLDGFPADAYFEMNPDYPKDVNLEDVIVNRERMRLISPAFATFLQEHALNNTEFLPVTIKNHNGGTASDEYMIASPLDVIDCIDKDASNVMWNKIDKNLIAGVYELVFNEDAIPEDVKILRPKHLEMFVFIREDIVEAIEEAGFTGNKFYPVDEFSY